MKAGGTLLTGFGNAYSPKPPTGYAAASDSTKTNLNASFMRG
jgi:hypothetical protein